jgi:FkbM family methyltransferase
MRWLRKYGYYLFSIWELLTGIENPWLILKIFAGRAGTVVKTIRLRRTKLSFNVRGAMDVWSIKETFIDRFYERYGFTLQPGWTVLDVGAALGEFSLFAAHTVPGCHIFAFEPFPESVALLQENLRLNGTLGVQIFPEAIAAQSGILGLDLTSGEPLQFQSRLEASDGHKHISVNAASFSGLFERLCVADFDLVKMDCEGAEYDILFNTPTASLQHIQRLVMEYHDHVTPYTHNDLVRFLGEQGFMVETFRNPVHAYLGYLRASRP